MSSFFSRKDETPPMWQTASTPFNGIHLALRRSHVPTQKNIVVRASVLMYHNKPISYQLKDFKLEARVWKRGCSMGVTVHLKTHPCRFAFACVVKVCHR